jgi:hypothetical protein
MALFGRKDYPDCTPERERQLLSEVQNAVKKEAYLKRRQSNVPVNEALSQGSEARALALTKLSELKRTCGTINALGTPYRGEKDAYEALYKHYKDRFNKDDELGDGDGGEE